LKGKPRKPKLTELLETDAQVFDMPEYISPIKKSADENLQAFFKKK
jgi:hypothetical protein